MGINNSWRTWLNLLSVIRNLQRSISVLILKRQDSKQSIHGHTLPFAKRMNLTQRPNS